MNIFFRPNPVSEPIGGRPADCGIAARCAVALLPALLLAACGGGGGSDPVTRSTAPGTPAAGASAGSPAPARPAGEAVLVAPIDDVDQLAVKGVRLDDASLAVVDPDGRPLEPDALDVGMVAEVAGRIDADGTNGTARRARLTDALQGPVERTDGATLVAMGTTVRTDSSTTLDGVASAAELAAGDPVRVYGLAQPDGSVLATRIERHAQAFGELRLRGTSRLLNLGAQTFDLGTLRVTYSGAIVRGTLAEGAVVVVRAPRPPEGGVLVASAVTVEPAVPFAEEAIAGIEGFVSGFVSIAQFRVAGFPVDASGAAVGGLPGVLRDGVRVTVRGTWRGGRLVADSVGLLDPQAPRRIVNVGPLLTTPFWWGPAFWGPGWVPWVGTGVSFIVGTPIVVGGRAPLWLASPLPPAPLLATPLRPVPGTGFGAGGSPGLAGSGTARPVPGTGFGTGGLGTVGAGTTGIGVIGAGTGGFGPGGLGTGGTGTGRIGVGIGDSPNFAQPVFGAPARVTRPIDRPRGGWLGGGGRRR